MISDQDIDAIVEEVSYYPLLECTAVNIAQHRAVIWYMRDVNFIHHKIRTNYAEDIFRRFPFIN